MITAAAAAARNVSQKRPETGAKASPSRPEKQTVGEDAMLMMITAEEERESAAPRSPRALILKVTDKTRDGGPQPSNGREQRTRKAIDSPRMGRRRSRRQP